MAEAVSFIKHHRLQYTDYQDDDDHSTKHEPDFSPFGVVASSFLGGGHPQLLHFTKLPERTASAKARDSGVK